MPCCGSPTSLDIVRGKNRDIHDGHSVDPGEPGAEAIPRRLGQRGMVRGAVVVVLSDGWERGEPEHLGQQTARLHRLAYQVIWAIPRKARSSFAPRCGPGPVRWPATPPRSHCASWAGAPNSSTPSSSAWVR